MNGDNVEGYCAYENKFFETSSSPYVLFWDLKGRCEHDTNREYMVRMLKQNYGMDVKSYEVRFIPKDYKRNKYDNAKLLIVKTKSGNHFAKRYNNNQVFQINFNRRA